MHSTPIRIAALGGLFAVSTWIIHGQAQELPPFPGLKEGFTYDWVERQSKGETLVQTFAQVIAYRKDGSSVVAMTSMDGTPAALRLIKDLSAATSSTAHSLVKAVTTLPMDDRKLKFEQDSLHRCAYQPDAVRTTLFGFEVVYSEFDPGKQMPNFPRPNMRIEKWSAPALGCAVLQEIMTDNERRVVRQAENIRLGEPDAALFEVPADYDELSPAQVNLRAIERYPQPTPQRECEPEDANCIQSEKMRMQMEQRAEDQYWNAQALRKGTARPGQ